MRHLHKDQRAADGAPGKQDGALKQIPNATVMKNVRATDRNTRAVAKLTSAMWYLQHADVDAAMLFPLLDTLLMERQQLRRALWDELNRQGVA